jgi:dimeric dUTPase (all-alpha-NTP-PPase superfamily)
LKKASSSDDKVCLAVPSERLTHCWPIQMINSSARDLLTNPNTIIEEGWLIDLPEIELDKALKVSSNHLKLIVEQFLIIWYTHNEFMKKLEKAKQFLILEEMEANAAGPRTIQEVRRERQKISSTKEADNTDGSAEMQTIIDNTQQLTLNEGDGGGDESREENGGGGGGGGGVGNHHIVFNMKNIICREILNNSIGITVIWVCRWQEKIRWGMHHIPFITILSPILYREMITSSSLNPSSPYFSPVVSSSSSSSSSSTSSSLPLVDNRFFHHSLSYLQFAINHLKQIDWKINMLHQFVPVTITIKSLSNHRNISFSLQGLSHQYANINKISNQKNNEILLSKISNLGFIWSGKSRYNNMIIKPKEEILFHFMIEVKKPGVYNLNR